MTTAAWAGSVEGTSHRGTRVALARGDDASPAWAREAYGHLPLSFEANLGQTDAQVRLLARGPGYTLFLTPTDTVLRLGAREAASSPVRHVSGSNAARMARPAGAVLRLQLVGSNPRAQVAGRAPLLGRASYFVGNDPARWHMRIPTYAKVQYQEVYSGVDLVYYGSHGQPEYDFVVAPGADPSVIRSAVQGAERLELDTRGDLVLHTAAGTVRQHRPRIYQEIGGVRRKVPGGYVRLGHDQVGVWVGAYDATWPLVIDPVLAYSTYLGGSSFDQGLGIAVDPRGAAFVTGVTSSPNFPTANALQPTLTGTQDAFVAQLERDGSALVYSTYLGGRLNDLGQGIAVDGAGDAYVTGQTESTDFPTANALQPSTGGGVDAFVTKTRR